MRTPVARTAAVLATAALVLAAGCSTESDSGAADSEDGDSVSVEPASAPVSPATASAPAGVVTTIPALNFTTFDASTHRVLALDADSTELWAFDADNPTSPPKATELESPAAGIFPGAAGTVLLPIDGGVLSFDIAGENVTKYSVDGDAKSAAPLPDGGIAVGDSTGVIHVLDDQGSQTDTVTGLSSVDAIAVTDDGISALDRHQTSLTEVDVTGGSLGIALRAGEGAARLAVAPYGRVLVTDAVGKELLVFTSDDLIMRQRFPVGTEPWAIAYDEKSDIVWVTLPAVNEVVGYTMNTGIPVEAARYPTVRQPDSVTVDSRTGTLFVGSAVGDGLQRIEPQGGT